MLLMVIIDSMCYYSYISLALDIGHQTPLGHILIVASVVVIVVALIAVALE
jgi:ABC-type uncharacterized transport system permease subunit